VPRTAGAFIPSPPEQTSSQSVHQGIGGNRAS